MDATPHADDHGERAEPHHGLQRVGHRYAATVRQRVVRAGLDLTLRHGNGFTSGQQMTDAPEIERTATILSEYRQQVKGFRRELGRGKPISGRQWKKARRELRKAGLL